MLSDVLLGFKVITKYFKAILEYHKWAIPTKYNDFSNSYY